MMHCLFFDVRPKPGHKIHYFDHVARLKPILARHEGLIYLERFIPLDAPEALLSHQLWRDEAAIAAWRTDNTHRASQSAGRKVHFEGYRIRVGAEREGTDPGKTGRFVIASYGDTSRSEAGRVYDSVTSPGYRLRLVETTSGEAAQAISNAAKSEAETVRIFDISRDYGMTDRAEAPSGS